MNRCPGPHFRCVLRSYRGQSAWPHDTSIGRCVIGDWKYVNGGWEYDSGAPDADPTVTSMLPIYAGSAAEPVITAGSPSDTAAEQPSRTAGEQDHTDPWCYAGAEADPPVNY